MAVPKNAGELTPFAQNAVTVLEEFPNEYKHMQACRTPLVGLSMAAFGVTKVLPTAR